MKSFKLVLNLALALIIIAVPLTVWYKAQAIEDWWRLRDYTAPANIAELASQDTMTHQATHDFYVNHPLLVGEIVSFRQDCAESEQAIVLGCYHPGQAGIYIYQISDKRLNGVEQVTAAHEMLHAGYERLSSKDKTYVDGLLENYYRHDLTDVRIKNEIASYKKTEPNDVVNEMHSVFGTEASNLTPALENYYKRYFVDRGAVVKYSQNYEYEFTSRQGKIDAVDAELAGMKANIAAEEQKLQSELSQINSDRARLGSEHSSGQTDQYNSDVPGFNHEVDTYNSGVTQLQSDIKTYNNLVDERNSLAKDLASLSQAIDTRLTTQSAQ